MSTQQLIRDQGGFTLVEQLVAAAAGLIVLFAVTSLFMTSLRQTADVNGRIDANQRARIGLYQVMDELHSACVAPQIAPVRDGSTSTALSFIHQTGSAVAPTPVLSTIALSGGTLRESVYPATGGSIPNWTFASTPSSVRQIVTGVSASGGTPLFSYYAYSNGQLSSTALPTPLSASDASRAVQVSVAMTVAPSDAAVRDANAPISIRDSALLRFTPAAFSTSANNLPCQ
ncbi:MAG: hypothetical protein U0R52_09300 [Solirubrobacterales bacterium]